MQVRLQYGESGLPLEIRQTPGFQGVLAPQQAACIADPDAALRRALQTPIACPALRQMAANRTTACIVVSDSTRPVPNSILLPPILETLHLAGLERQDIQILVATGIHRPSTAEEKKQLLGERIAAQYHIIDHLSKQREDMLEVGRIAGEVPALVNRHYLKADLKILTGFIEPHMWAGYSGGRKAILPGISSVETLQFMHGPQMVAHPLTTYGVLEGNPFHQAGLEVMGWAGADFLVNVTLDSRKRITGIFAGHPVEAHLRGCEELARHCVRTLDHPLDFAITTNAGAPLDCNLYQTVKGMTAAAAVVRPGGDILIASRCNEGVGSEEYRRILGMAASPREFLQRLLAGEFFIPDQWCAQEMYQVLTRHRVWLYTEGIPADEVRRYHLQPVPDLSLGIEQLLRHHGNDARWAVIPDGPLLILKLLRG